MTLRKREREEEGWMERKKERREERGLRERRKRVGREKRELEREGVDKEVVDIGWCWHWGV